MAGGTGVERHAAAAACDGKGIRVEGLCRNSLRNPNDLRGRERIAHHNLALRRVPRPAGAAGGVRCVHDLHAAARFHRRFATTACGRSLRRTAARVVAGGGVAAPGPRGGNDAQPDGPPALVGRQGRQGGRRAPLSGEVPCSTPACRLRPPLPVRDLRWSWFVGQSEGGIKVYSDWFGALDERTLPTEPDDVNGIVEASADVVWESRSVTTGSTLPVVANQFAAALAGSPEGPERSGGAAKRLDAASAAAFPARMLPGRLTQPPSRRPGRLRRASGHPGTNEGATLRRSRTTIRRPVRRRGRPSTRAGRPPRASTSATAAR